VYLLPNLFTTAALFAGFYAIVLRYGRPFPGARGLDLRRHDPGRRGWPARAPHQHRDHFGAEYDSLSDMISFGLAPALVMLQWSLGLVGEAPVARGLGLHRHRRDAPKEKRGH
jgi:CDP-diacylglycerol--serine O-phosphatidyltransferase